MEILKALIDFLLAYAITQGNDRVYKKTAYLFIFQDYFYPKNLNKNYLNSGPA